MSEPTEPPEPTEATLDGITFRRPTEPDYPRVVRVIDDWWGGRKMDFLLPRLWLQHFTGTSWLAETADGALAGFLIGFHSPDHPEVAYCRLIGTNPNLRLAGLGRALYEHFFDDARRAGRHEIRAITWPGNRISIAFHRAMGFEILAGPGSQNLYGVPAFPGYDFDREDRAILVRSI